jgi:hypothetical protein
MPFHVICLETQEPIESILGGPAVYVTGSQAASAADALYRATGKKYKPQRIKGDHNAWKKRQADRFLDGTYSPLPWHKEAWFRGSIGETEHFAHVSKEKPGMIAFTENEEKGEADIVTRIKAGTYLERFFSDSLTSGAIQTYARDFAGRYEQNGLKFAVTEDEIAHVYIHGPRSCMSGPEKGTYQSPKHPCRVYAAGDLQVAYLERSGSIIARSVVWPDKKRFYNIYGDSDRLRPLLTKEGYKQSRLTGAKLQRVEFKKGGTTYLVCPHIDGDGRVTLHPDHLTIGGDVPAASTSGAIHCPTGTRCTHCNTWGHDRASMQHLEDVPNSLYCTSCYKNSTYLCKATGVRYGNPSNVWNMRDARGIHYFWSRAHFRDHGAVCAATSAYMDKAHMVQIGPKQWVSASYFKDAGFTCKACDKKLLKQGYSSKTKNVCYSCQNLWIAKEKS